MDDTVGIRINVGDTVHVNYIDRGRGAEMWMDKGTVVGFGRTRVLVKFPSRTEPQAVGPECLRVVNTYTVRNFLDDVGPSLGWKDES